MSVHRIEIVTVTIDYLSFPRKVIDGPLTVLKYLGQQVVQQAQTLICPLPFQHPHLL